MPESYIKKSLNKYMTSIATNVLEELSRITTPFNRYHYNYHVYIMTLPDLSNFKEAHSFITKPIIGKRFYDAIKYATISYNRALVQASKGYNNIKVINSGHYLDSLAAKNKFNLAIKEGKSCINSSASYTLPTATNNNCQYKVDGKNFYYYSWNNAHLVSYLNDSLSNWLSNKIK